MLIAPTLEHVVQEDYLAEKVPEPQVCFDREK
jgi:hypothetical protein